MSLLVSSLLWDMSPCRAWQAALLMVVIGNSRNVILFEPTTSEHISARTIDQIAVSAIAPAADCRTFAIGSVSLL